MFKDDPLSNNVEDRTLSEQERVRQAMARSLLGRMPSEDGQPHIDIRSLTTALGKGGEPGVEVPNPLLDSVLEYEYNLPKPRLMDQIGTWLRAQRYR